MADEPRPAPAPIFEIPYLRLFPWLRLFRIPSAAANPKALVLAVLGLGLMAAGWDLLDRIFPASAGITPTVFELRELIGPDSLQTVPWFLTEPLRLITAPFFATFDLPDDLASSFHALLACLWVILVWGLAGGAIARIVVVKLAKDERVGLRESLLFAVRKALPLIATPIVPLLGVAIVAAPIAAFSLLYRLPGPWGSTIAGLFAFLPLLGGLLLTLILLGLAVGWPLMQASVAAESEDGFDAMSRSYAYIHQRPWHFIAYILLAFAIGCAGLVFVDVFARLVVHLTAWSLSLAGSRRSVETFYVLGFNDAAPPDFSTHKFWLGLIAALVRGWVYSAFWTAAAIIYLLLRKDVDGTPITEIAHTSRPSIFDSTPVGASTSPGEGKVLIIPGFEKGEPLSG